MFHPRPGRVVGGSLLVASLAIHGCGREPGQSSHGTPAPDSTQTARRRIAFLEAARSFGGGELQRALQHPDARVRRAAAIALGRIQDAAALKPLLPLIEDPDSTVSQQAAFALGQLQGVGDADRHALQAALVAKIDNLQMPRLAVYLEALGKQGGPEILSVLEPYLATGAISGMGSEARPPVVEGMAALGLARLRKAEAREILSQVGGLLSREQAAAWRIAAAMAADPDTAFRSSLVSLLEHPHRFARAGGARALGKLGDRSVVPQLVQHLSDLDWEVRASLLVALAELADPGSPDRDTMDFCAALAGDTHPLVREAAVAALDSFGVGQQVLVLRERLADPAPAVRLAALQALARDQHAAARDAWEAARRDSIEFVRAGALHAARWVLGESAARDVLLSSLRAGAVQERAQAAAALAELAPARGAKRALERRALESALGDPDFVVAALAADALGKLQFLESAPALAAAYEAHQRSHQDIDVRLAAVTAAGDCIGKPRRVEWNVVRALCERASRDADARVAHAAAIGLARLQGQPDPPLPAPRARPAVVRPDSLPAVDLGLVDVRLVTRYGDAVLELDGDRFPRTVANFLQLVDSGFYCSGVFHRVVPAFVVQGGDPRGDGWGDAGRSVPCEYGDLRYDDAGIVGMAHAGKDTGGSQFFITHLPVPRLDGRYTAFGRVAKGMDVVDKIVRGDWFRIERVPPAPPR